MIEYKRSSHSSDLETRISSALSSWNSSLSNSDLDFPEGDSSTSIPREDSYSNSNEINSKKRKAENEASSRILNDSDDILSPERYNQRLQTFDVGTYFAKPNAISPMICARFGWENTSCDMLTCSNLKCRAVICVKIHYLLGNKTMKDLTSQYRRMLATSHVNSCPFRIDAERWLLNYFPSSNIERIVVPSYLTKVCPNLSLFDERQAIELTKYSRNGKSLSWTWFVINEFIDNLDQVLLLFQRHLDENSNLTYKVDLPIEAINYLIQKNNGAQLNDQGREPIVKFFLNSLLRSSINSQVNRSISKNEQELFPSQRTFHSCLTEPTISKVPKLFTRDTTEYNELKILKMISSQLELYYQQRLPKKKVQIATGTESAVLALFGWSPIGVQLPSANNNLNDIPNVVVKCRFCQATATVSVIMGSYLDLGNDCATRKVSCLESTQPTSNREDDANMMVGNEQPFREEEKPLNSSPSAPKRQKVSHESSTPASVEQISCNIESTITAKLPNIESKSVEMNPIKSHRSFCPYVSSLISDCYDTKDIDENCKGDNIDNEFQEKNDSNANVDSTFSSKLGWQIVMDKLMVCHKNDDSYSKTPIKASKSFVEAQSYEPENSDSMIQKILDANV